MENQLYLYDINKIIYDNVAPAFAPFQSPLRFNDGYRSPLPAKEGGFFVVRQSPIKFIDIWGNDDPLFPATMVGQGSDMKFGPVGLARKNWKTTAAIPGIL